MDIWLKLKKPSFMVSIKFNRFTKIKEIYNKLECMTIENKSTLIFIGRNPLKFQIDFYPSFFFIR